MKRRGKETTRIRIVEHTNAQWQALQDDALRDNIEDALNLALKTVQIHCTLDGLIGSDLTTWQLSYLGSLFVAASNCRLKMEEEGETP